MKVKDLINDLSKLDQEAEMCIGDTEGYYSYEKDCIKKIKKSNGYNGYVIADRHQKYEGQVKR